MFQKYYFSSILKIGKKIKKITKKNKVKLIINDFFKIAKLVNADGCHIGQSDGTINSARYVLKKKIIGITCHGSKRLILNAIKDKPNYLALGSFFKSKLKPDAKKARKDLIIWTK